MAKKKEESAALNKAESRNQGITTFDDKYDLGNGYTKIAYEAKINALKKKMFDHNALIDLVNAAANEIEAMEKELNTFSSGALKAVGLKFGFNSNEYEMAGGTRISDKKKPTKKGPDNK